MSAHRVSVLAALALSATTSHAESMRLEQLLVLQ